MEFYNWKNARIVLERLICEYQRSAPELCAVLDDIYIALEEKPEAVTVAHLCMIADIWNSGQPISANYAQNLAYKVMGGMMMSY